ncbi:amidohydrolase [Microbacterium sp. P07]|uniref:amidohydrolase n=1 Tax=Microbacterium sp. P07 TaxID=3366952 RepID=UPI003745C86A
MIGAQIGTIRRARIAGAGRELLPDDGPFDIFLSGGRIVDIAPTGAVRSSGEVLDAEGAWLIPGLWDHHVHALPWALTSQRVDVGAAETAREAATLAGASASPDGRVIGVGFRDVLWPDEPSLELLDAATGDVPTYLINADVHSVWLNTAAFRREGFAPEPSGILREEIAFEVSRRLNAADPVGGDRLVAQAARAAAARGVVGMIDFDMTRNDEAWMRRAAAGFDVLRVRYGIYPEHLDQAIDEGLRSGDRVRGGHNDLVRTGPLKVITDGSLGTRTAACGHPYADDPSNRGVMTVDPRTLTDLMMRATGAGLECAIHAIGDVANSHALDAFAVTGAVGTIEHAQLVAAADIPRFARLGVGASVQPEHAIDDRDVTDEMWAAQTAVAYPLRALSDAGANLTFGSDAPVSRLDPWAAIAGAVYRTRDGREAWRPEQRLDAAVALAAATAGGSLGGARIEPGALADLALCESDPLAASEIELREMGVRATLIEGRTTHVA